MAPLIHFAEIQKRVGGAALDTIVNWKMQYESFPVMKLGNKWVSESSALLYWFRFWCVDRLEDFNPLMIEDASQGAALIGILEIQKYIGNVSERTLMEWKRMHESFPIEKLGAQWASETRSIDLWFRFLCCGRLDEFRPPVVEDAAPLPRPESDVKSKSAPIMRKTRSKTSK